MKKTCIVLAITLLTMGLLFASPSWVGVQGTSSSTKATTTTTYLGVDFESENTTSFAGLNVAGTIYPGEAPVGVGFQVGFAKTIKSANDSDVSDYPLTWNGGVTGKFRLGVSDLFALEFGAGLLYERVSETYDFGGTEAQADLNTLSALIASDLVIHLSDSLAIVGGVDVAFPLTTQGVYSVGSTSYTEDFNVKGSTFSGKLGIALGF